VAVAALGAGSEARLYGRLREKEGWSYGAYAWLDVDSMDQRSELDAFATMAPGNAAPALAALVEELERLIAGGLEEAELERVKSTLLSSFKTSLANDDTVAGVLRGGLYLGRTLEFHVKQNAAIAALGRDDIARVLAKGYLDPKKLITVTAGDLDRPAPAAGDKPAATSGGRPAPSSAP
jgi:zinc protease